MLNKELCRLFGIDEFQQYLVNKQETLEQLKKSFDNAKINSEYVTVEIELLKEIREEYDNFIKTAEKLNNSQLTVDEILYKNDLIKEAKDTNKDVFAVLFDRAMQEQISWGDFQKLCKKFCD